MIRGDLHSDKFKHEHFTKKGHKRWKKKKSFETKEEALNYISKYRIKRIRPYQCSLCNKWHIGHFNKSK